MQENNLAYALLIEHGSQQSREPKPETTMRWATVLEKIKIELNGFEADTLFNCLSDQNLITMFALCPGRNFHPFPKQIKAFCQMGLFCLSHVIEGTDFDRIVGNKNELVTRLLFGIFTQESCALRINIAIFGFCGRSIPPFPQNFLSLVHRYFWKRMIGYHDFHTECFGDFSAMLFPDGLQHMTQPFLFKFHDVMMRFDPGHFHIHAREFGGMSGREGWVCPKGGTDLEYAIQPGCHCHL